MSALESQPEEGCKDAALPEFWMDMCTSIATNSSDFVNLAKNPERWTGYNGSHVWSAIYNENCVEKMGDLEEMCYEERVLYRVLSGMHSSINIHISETYYPPVKGKRDAWEPKPERFMQQFGSHPERLKNLHFAFVVLLRALRKAGPYLYNYPFSMGEPTEDATAKKLVQRLLDSHIMTSCKGVFEAFDESLMFQESSADTEGMSVQANLKKTFKDVFQNISSVMDCISCQKCKLHGKVQLLGLGAALKILLLPEQLILPSLDRNEIVALFNTLGKFSHAIRAAPILAAQYAAIQTAYKKTSILEEATRAPAPPPAPPAPPAPPPARAAPPAGDSAALVENGVAAVAAEARGGRLGETAEDAVRHPRSSLPIAVLCPLLPPPLS